MGTGKTTIGRALAKKLKLTHVDLDEAIVQHEGSSIAAIFEQKGEAYFRDLESTLLRTLLSKNDQVITTGGGAVLRPENVRAMISGGTVVALTATEEELVRRLSVDSSRPLLAGGVAERVRTLLEQRAGAYDFAPIQVDTTGKSSEQIVAEIMTRLI
ncbi:shikimate kinase, partial [Frankia sp. Cpl3]|nr:shikimate kinase [Frankia sp. Cpl3]